MGNENEEEAKNKETEALSKALAEKKAAEAREAVNKDTDKGTESPATPQKSPGILARMGSYFTGNKNNANPAPATPPVTGTVAERLAATFNPMSDPIITQAEPPKIEVAPIDISKHLVQLGQKDIDRWNNGLKVDSDLSAQQLRVEEQQHRAYLTLKRDVGAAVAAGAAGAYNQNALVDKVDAVMNEAKAGDYIRSGMSNDQFMAGASELIAVRKRQIAELNALAQVGKDPAAVQADTTLAAPVVKEKPVNYESEALDKDIADRQKDLTEKMEFSKRIMGGKIGDDDKAAAKKYLGEIQKDGEYKSGPFADRNARDQLELGLSKAADGTALDEKDKDAVTKYLQQQNEYKQDVDKIAAERNGAKQRQEKQEELAEVEAQYGKSVNAALTATSRYDNQMFDAAKGNFAPNGKWNGQLVEGMKAPGQAVYAGVMEVTNQQLADIGKKRQENAPNVSMDSFERNEMAHGEDKTEKILGAKRDGQTSALNVPQNSLVMVTEGTDGYNVTIRSEDGKTMGVPLENLSSKELKNLTFKVSDVGTTRFEFIGHDGKPLKDFPLNVEGNYAASHTRNMGVDLVLHDTDSNAYLLKKEQSSLSGEEMSPAQARAREQAREAMEKQARAERKLEFQEHHPNNSLAYQGSKKPTGGNRGAKHG